MPEPSPAIVAQKAVKRLPRLALWAFCAAYVLPGFFGRGPWKHDDVTALGYMLRLAQGHGSWWSPSLGLGLDADALLPYWLGALSLRLAPSWLAADLAARLPFVLLLGVALAGTWYGTYYLARSPMAQPVAFAFGGEARPTDYARAIADGGLLAFIACLGLAQLSHEATPAAAQLCFAALLFYGSAALPYHPFAPLLAAALGLGGLSLSGAPSVALMLGLSTALVHLRGAGDDATDGLRTRRRASVLVALGLVWALLVGLLGLWRWRISLPQADWLEWQSLGRLFLWFTWPSWPLALWTLWRWRKQWLSANMASRHIWLPLCLVLVASAATLTTSAADRSLLLALPALAALAAFALPTLDRSVAALIDWFTLIFFTGCALIIWVVWFAMLTGVPAQPAANVARLAPGFHASLSVSSSAIALLASAVWAWLVAWRVGRHRAAIWKSVVLPAGGAALCWLLLMTLWLPLLDYARSYTPMVRQVTSVIAARPGCVAVQGLRPSQIAALEVQAGLTLQALTPQTSCRWLIADAGSIAAQTAQVAAGPWHLRRRIGHPSDRDEALQLFERQSE